MQIYSLATTLALVAFAQAHGGHEQQPIDPNADWATRHMAGTWNACASRLQLLTHILQQRSTT